RGVARRGCDLLELPRYTPWQAGSLSFRLALSASLFV
ncbi:MAG: hypothetical protein RIR70_1664, partial [Pseudomonadota bacterium]